MTDHTTLTALSAEADALKAQVAELTRERDEARASREQWQSWSTQNAKAAMSWCAQYEAAEAKVARLEGVGQRLVGFYDSAVEDLIGEAHRSFPDSDEMAEIRRAFGAPALTEGTPE